MSCRILVLKWPRGIPISPFIEIHVDCFGNAQDRLSVFRTISALRFCISFELINFVSQKQVWSHSLTCWGQDNFFICFTLLSPAKLREGNVFSYVYPSVCSWGGLIKQGPGSPLYRAVSPYMYRAPALTPT